MKDPPPLTQHVEVQLRKQWDVGQHDDDQEVVIVKGHVVFVGKPQGEHAGSPDIR